MSEWEKAKNWFGDGEYDVELMINLGVVTKHQVLESYRNNLKPREGQGK